MHFALQVPELLSAIFSWLELGDLTRVCGVCREFREHGTPLLWANLSLHGLDPLHKTFPDDSITSSPIHCCGGVRSPDKRLSRPLTYNEACKVASLSRHIRSARISASTDLIVEANSPLLSAQDLINGKLFPSLRKIQLDHFYSPWYCSCRDDEAHTYNFGVLDRTFHFFIGPATEQLDVWEIPPVIPSADSISLILNAVKQQGANIQTFRVGFRGFEKVHRKPSSFDSTQFIQTVRNSLPSLRMLGLYIFYGNNTEAVPLLLLAATQLPQLIDLDLWDVGFKHNMAFVPQPSTSEIGFPALKKLRVKCNDYAIKQILEIIPDSCLQELHVWWLDEMEDELCSYLRRQSQATSLTICMDKMPWGPVSSGIPMTSLTHLILESKKIGGPMTDDVVELIASSYPRLVLLKLRDRVQQQPDWNVTFRSLFILAERCPQLRTLALSVSFDNATVWRSHTDMPATGGPASTGLMDDTSHEQFWNLSRSPTPTHLSLRHLDLRYSKGIEEERDRIDSLVKAVVCMYPNLQAGRCEYRTWYWAGKELAGETVNDGDHADAAWHWWRFWKAVKMEMGDGFTIDYTLRDEDWD